MSRIETTTSGDELDWALHLANKAEDAFSDSIWDERELTAAEAQVAALCAIARALVGIGFLMSDRGVVVHNWVHEQ